jgi:hypothetical protein
MSAMPIGALAKNRWKRSRDRRSAASHSRSGVRSRTIEWVRNSSPSPMTLWPIQAWTMRPSRLFSTTSPRCASPARPPNGSHGAAPVARRRREKIVQPDIAADQLGRGRAEPARQRRVDEQEAPVAIDRVEADRRLVEEIDEAVALVADHPLHLVARGDVLDMPEAVAGPAGDRVDRDVEPARRRAARILQRHRGDGARAGHRLAAQALEIDAGFEIGDRGGEAIERRRHRARRGW